MKDFEIYINIPVTSEQEEPLVECIDQDDIFGVIMFWTQGFSIFVEDFPVTRDRDEYIEWLKREITEYFDVDFEIQIDPTGDAIR
ncbi:hypothetical protein VPHD479_0136 [Vibrio phage D479]